MSNVHDKQKQAFLYDKPACLHDKQEHACIYDKQAHVWMYDKQKHACLW